VREDDEPGHALEAALDGLDPTGSPYSSRAGVEFHVREFDDDPVGYARWRCDLAARRLRWLESRWAEWGKTEDLGEPEDAFPRADWATEELPESEPVRYRMDFKSPDWPKGG
jgi:hypothetical protein